MKRLGLGALYELGLLVILLGVVVHAPLTVGLGSLWPDYATGIKAWKELLLVGLALMATVLLTRQKLWRTLFKSRLVLLSAAFVGLHLFLALLLRGDAVSVIVGLIIDLRFIAIFVLMYVLMLVRPQAIRPIVKVIAAGAVIVISFGLLQITVLPDDVLKGLGYSSDTIRPFTTIDNNTDYVRINSTLRGPNPLGALAVVYVTLLLAWFIKSGATASVVKSRVAIATAIGATAVLFASYSRSAYLALIAAVVVLALSFKRFTKQMVIAGVGGVILVAIAGLAISTTDWFSNVILHEDPESTVVSKSNDEHIASLENGAMRVAKQPLGAGIGSTGSASLYDSDTSNDIMIENYYFFVAHESGWLGIGIFLALFVETLRALWRRRSEWLALGLFASGIGLFIIGLLLPVWVDETIALIWWGLAGASVATSAIMGSGNGRTTTRQQKTTRAT